MRKMTEKSLEDNLIDIHLFSGHYWSEILKKLKRGTVFLERDIYRVLHFNGGVNRLFSEGKILGLREFSSFIYGTEKDNKGVFILSSPLMGQTMDTLKEILSNSSFEYVQVITTASPSIHSSEDSGDSSQVWGTNAFKDIEETILSWMGDFNYTCEIFHYPVNLAPLSNELFLTPTFDELFPIYCDGMEEKFVRENKGDGNDGVLLWSKLSDEIKLSVRRFASFWASFLGMYNVRPDIFTAGNLSSIIADRINILLSLKERNQTTAPLNDNKVSLIFLDRTSDCVSITSKKQANSSGLGLILENLLPYPDSKEDVLVDMSDLFNSDQGSPHGCVADNSSSIFFDALLLSKPECFKFFINKLRKASKGLQKKSELYESDLMKEFITVVKNTSQEYELNEDDAFTSLQKESVMQNNRIIRDIRGDKQLALGNYEESNQCKKLLSNFKLQNDAILNNIELLQKSFALINAHDKFEDQREESEIFITLQEEIKKDLSTKHPEVVFETLIKVVKDKNKKMSLFDIFSLIIFTYSRLSPECIGKDPEAEDELESLISDRLLNEKECVSRMIRESSLDELLAHKIVKKFFSKCERLNGCTSNALRKSNFSQTLIELLINDMYSDDYEDLPYLTYKSRGSLGGRLIKSGLSLFGLSVKEKKVHPRENPIIFIFIVGGITPSEIKKIRDCFQSNNSRAQVIIGSNRLLHSNSIVDMFFLEDVL
ncbi:sec1 family domain-containing protein 2 isoform X2 [Lepeophtheirus salmonis]|uniref:sec1 family domain-containing protein 2 isoform X2 n=1 Tax=Lepeophtheirus salmonis TaxID=72036 RepID=UPI003AF3C98B